MGYILLEGGAEFNGRMREADLEAMQLAGGADQPIGIIPAAAWPDHNHLNAAQRAEHWFHGLGATNVKTLPVFDASSANAPNVAKTILGCKFIFILGGFPHHLALTLADSLALKAIGEGRAVEVLVAGLRQAVAREAPRGEIEALGGALREITGRTYGPYPGDDRRTGEAGVHLWEAYLRGEDQ